MLEKEVGGIKKRGDRSMICISDWEEFKEYVKARNHYREVSRNMKSSEIEARRADDTLNGARYRLVQKIDKAIDDEV
jgi:K+/H+ antiporter YhaU regulatory subunit KhtT